MIFKREVEFTFGEIVFLKTDPDQKERIVTGIIMRPEMSIYYVSCNTTETCHYDIELSRDKDIIKSFSN